MFHVHEALFRAASSLAFAAGLSAQSNQLFLTEGQRSGQYLGTYLAAFDDDNGDKVPDFVASSHWPGISSRYFELHVRSGKDGSVLRLLYRSPLGALARHLSGGFDFDSDGRSDVLLGSAHKNGVSVVRVLSGKTGKLLLDVGGADGFGESIAPCGDMDGDKVLDFAVGASAHMSGRNQVGAVHLISGKTGARIRTIVGFEHGGLFGRVVACPGDLDRDGKHDVVVGSPGINFARQRGPVFAFSGKTGKFLYELRAYATPGGMPTFVVPIGDINKDGSADYAVGSKEDVWQRNTPRERFGYVRLVSGRDGTNLQVLTGPNKGERLGSRFAVLGDVDSDGKADYLASGSSSPRSFDSMLGIYSGASGRELGREINVNSSWASALVVPGDLNADGRPDYVASNPQARVNRIFNVGEIEGFSGVPTPQRLRADTQRFSLRSGGLATLTLDGGSQAASQWFLMAGSASGSFPGVSFGNVNIPVRFDPYTIFLYQAGGSLMLPVIGLLDGRGRAIVRFRLPAGLPTSLSHTQLTHAFVALKFTTFQPILASNPVSFWLLR